MNKDYNLKLKLLNKYKIIFILIIGSVIFFSFFKSFKDYLVLKNYYSKSIYVYNFTDNKVEIGLNESKRLPLASLTKIVTVMVSLENINDLSEIAPVDSDSYLEMVNKNSSMAGFRGNEQTTYRDLLYGAILSSGGEAADSLAINISGSIDDFVFLMNKFKDNLKLKNTNFKNAEGMDDENHFSSAEDIAKILKYSLNDGDFRAIFTKKEFLSTQTLDHPQGLLITSTVFNKLKDYSRTGFEIEGGKSGTTFNAGHCLATLCKKNEKEYIVVVMGSPIGDDFSGDGEILDTIKIMSEI